VNNLILMLSAVGSLSLPFTRNGNATAPHPTPSELLKEYESLGLPLPPKTAKLVLFKDGGNSKEQLAIEFKPGTILLRGLIERKAIWVPQIREIAPDIKAIEGLYISEQEAVVLAIQCQSMGWDGLAKKLLEQSQKDAKITPLKHLLNSAWYYWEDQITHPTADRGLVAKRLKELMARDADLDTEKNRWLLERLELAVVPSNAKPGSIEALIDDLVNYHTDSATIFPRKPGVEYQRLAAFGFDAVSALIEHLDDQRLTRAKMTGFNNFRSWNLRVCDVVGDLVERLADEELRGNWLTRQQGYMVKKSAAQEWWEKARKMNEEVYLLDHVLSNNYTSNKQSCINEHILYVLGVKYPKHIPNLKINLYRRLLEKRSDLPSGDLAKAVSESKIPEKEKLELFVLGAKNKVLDVRINALAYLKTLDKRQFTTLLLETLENFPTDAADYEYDHCREALIAGIVVGCDEPRVWDALQKAMKRAEIGLRMEILDRLSYMNNASQKVKHLHLLESFSDDTALRDTTSSRRYRGLCAGYTYEKIQVRDFVTLKIAELLNVKIDFKGSRTDEEWAKIRETVQTRLREELKGEKK
jgi:hypothetical protein